MHSSSSNVPTLLSENDMNSFPILDDSLFNFPYSPQIHHSDYEAVYLNFNDHFYQQHSSNTEDTMTIAADQSITNSNVDSKGECSNSVATKEKRCSKNDKHSKINTMHGPRDRRMRLSLDVARKFFNLQDLLGFNKPSKTVDWLLKSSRTAITELEGGRGLDALKSSNSKSCEEVLSSGVDNLSNLYSSITVEKGLELETTLLISAKKKKLKKVKAGRPSSVARETRIKARERARERTSQKKRFTENQPKQCADKRILRATDETFTNSLFSAAGECNPSMVFNYDIAGLIPNPHFLAELK